LERRALGWLPVRLAPHATAILAPPAGWQSHCLAWGLDETGPSGMKAAPPQTERDTAPLAAHDLWKFYGDRAVVGGIGFELGAGEVLGLLGANGAGKTTTVGMLYGSVIPSRGFVRVDRYEVRRQGRQARFLMGIVTQEDNLDPDFNVFENLAYFAHYYRITGRAAQHRAGELLAQVGLQAYSQYRIDELSGGLKRRLVLARALINRPRIVFLDEPTTGLDPDARQDFWRAIAQLQQSGCGIVLTTHYMEEAQRLCDRLLLLQQGQVIDSGPPEALIERTVGEQVIEVAGVGEAELQPLARQYGSWYRPFGNGYLLGGSATQPEAFWRSLNAIEGARPQRRRANLEDVFLRLTGTQLD